MHTFQQRLYALMPTMVWFLTIGATVFVVGRMQRPQYVQAQWDRWMLGTFRTENLQVDNNTVFGGKVQTGPIAPNASQQAWFSLQSSSTTTQQWMQEDDTGHVGSGGNNEAINLVLRDFTGFAMGSGGTATAGALDIHVNASKSSGSGTLETLAILATAEGGDDNFDYLSLGGTMKHVAGPALFSTTTTDGLTTGGYGLGSGGNADLSKSSAIILNENITSPKNTFPGDSSHTPQVSLGVATQNDGTGLQIKNTNGTQGLSGIDLLADTAVNSHQSTGVFMTRGNGGGGGAAGNNPAGIALIGNAGSVITNGAVGDMAVYNQVAGGRLIFGADAVHASYQMVLDQSGNLTLGVPTGSGGFGQAHFISQQTSAPTVTSCGGSPAIVGTDMAATVTPGTGTPATCTVTFTNAYASAPTCVLSDRGGGGTTLGSYTVSASAIVYTFPTVSPSAFDYICFGH